jgi:hypothetical protein
MKRTNGREPKAAGLHKNLADPFALLAEKGVVATG